MEYVNARYVRQSLDVCQALETVVLFSSGKRLAVLLLIISYNMENKNRPPMPKSPPPDLPETYKRSKFGDPYGK